VEQFPAPEQVQVDSGTQTLACRVTWPAGGGRKCWNAGRRVGGLVMTRMRPAPSSAAIRAVVASPVTRGPTP
jgi:hypothetical protein